MKKRYLINVVLGLLIFFYLEYRLGVRETIDAMVSVDAGYLLLAIAVFLLSQLVRLVKWRIFYRQGRIRTNFVQVSHFYFRLKLFGMLTPGRLGEFLPAITSPSWKGSLISFTTYDRLTESMATLTVAVIAFTLLLRGVISVDLVPVVAGLIAVIILICVLCVRNAWMMGLARRIGDKLEGYRRFKPVARLLDSEKRVALEIRLLQKSFRKLFLPRTAVPILALTFLAVAVDLLFWWILFVSIGVWLPPGTLIAAVAIFNVSGFFSPTPGGIGISDSIFVLFLKTVGQSGAFGSFILLLRLTVFVLTALCHYAFHFGIEIRRARQIRP